MATVLQLLWFPIQIVLILQISKHNVELGLEGKEITHK